MKKLLSIAIILFIIHFNSSAQLLQSGFNGTGAYRIENSDVTKAYSQTMKVYNIFERIILDKKENGKSYFYKFNVQNSSSHQVSCVELPANYDIKDFDVLGSDIYFCGVIEESGRKDAFIGYADVGQFFNNAGNTILTSANYNFTKLLPPIVDKDTILDIRKIRAYYDRNGIVTLAAIGSMYYGSGVFEELGSYGNHYHTTTDPIDGKKYYYEYLLKYKIIESAYTIPLDTNTLYNSVAMYRNPRYNGQVNITDSDYVYNIADYSYAEYFEDMVLTDDYICIVSSTYQDSLDTRVSRAEEDGHDNKMMIRFIDKNSDSQQSTLIYQPDNIPYHPMYGVKLETMYGNTVALGYSRCNFPINSDYTRVYIGIFSCNNSVISNINTIYIDDDVSVKGDLLKDMKYDTISGELFVLKNKLYGNNIYSNQAIYRIDPVKGYNYQTTRLDLNRAFGLEDEILDYYAFPVWNNLMLFYNLKPDFHTPELEYNVAAIGKQKGSIVMFETNLRSGLYQCYDGQTVDIKSHKVATEPFEDLEICTFASVYYLKQTYPRDPIHNTDWVTVWEKRYHIYSTKVFNVTIEQRDAYAFKKREITTDCLSK